jgi:5-hydroxyisourate hydrolase-like protein (transthyretin family)
MRRFLFLPLLVAITATLLAQTPAPNDNKRAEDPASAPCTVTGRVVTAAEGDPLKSARISLIPEHNRSHNQIYAASSDSDGHFTLKDVPAGSYQFMASHTGFVEQHYKAGINDTGPLFSLKPGEKVSDILFRLVAAAVITGRVTNEDGDPMQRIEVVALRRPSEEEMEDDDESRRHKAQMAPVASAKSDDRGQYRIFGLKPGEYFVRAEDTFMPQGGRVPVEESFWLLRELGSEYAPVYFPGVIEASQAQVIPLKAAEEAQADVTMRRVKTVEITGRVIGSTGPAANALVILEPYEGSRSDFERQDTTDEKGSFRLRNIPEGTYYVLALLRDEGAPVYESRARQKIEVTGDNVEGLTISLNAGVTIQGKLKLDNSTSVPLDGIQVSLGSVEEDGQSGGFGQAKKDGSFEIKSVQEGGYAINLWGLDPKAYLKSARRGPDDLLEKGLQIEADSSGRIEMTIASDGAQLEGSVSDDDGPVIGARVRLVPDPLTPYNHLRIRPTTTDQLGHFSLTTVAPGKYKLTAKPMVSSESAAYKSEPQSVTLSENDRKTVDMKLEKKQE